MRYARPEQTLYGRCGVPRAGERSIGEHRVAHVGDVAPRFEVADAQDGIPAAVLDLGDLLREGRRRVVRDPVAGPHG